MECQLQGISFPEQKSKYVAIENDNIMSNTEFWHQINLDQSTGKTRGIIKSLHLNII